MKLNERTEWVELLRILACYSVILLHTAAQGFYVITDGWGFYNLYHGITRFAVPSFVMISGMFYLDENRPFDTQGWWKKKVGPTILLYVIWILSYSFFTTLRSYMKGIEFTARELFITMLTYESHLWYLRMLIGLMIMTPILRAITGSSNGKKLCEYYFAVSLFAVYLKHFVLLLDFPGKEYVAQIWNRITFGIPDHTPYYVMGYYIGKYYIGSRDKNAAIFAAGGIGILGSIILAHHYSVAVGSPIEDFYIENTIGTFLFTVAVFVFFKECVSKFSFLSGVVKTVLLRLSGCTMGIYLIHMAVLNTLEDFGVNTRNTGGGICLCSLCLPSRCLPL